MLLLSLIVDPASACGGFFCNNTTPVVQNAERIIFTVDEVAEVVETHVQVEYEGPADQFAWIVPVQAEPEIFLSTTALFDTVASQLQPFYQLSVEQEGHCKNPFRLPPPPWAWGSFESSISAPVADEAGGGYGVDVTARAAVGPYDTVTLQASDLDGLLRWLEDNDYAIPSTAGEALAPYVHAGGSFVALKLQKGNDAGDLAPLGLRYAGTRPAVPIQLTSVAAADDLRLEVTVFGERRAVPESYLHVTLNDAAIDWFDGGTNYGEVITRAADEAGGHAFATDYAGETSILFANFATTASYGTLSETTTPDAWIEELQAQGFQGSSDLLTFLQEVLPVRGDLNPTDVYNCPSCYSNWYLGTSFDAAALTERLRTEVVEPRRHAQAIIDRFPYVTRMTSSLSASEMTVDPVFTFTDAMGDVDVFRTASLVYECNGKYWRRAPRRLELPSGQVIPIPSERDLEKDELTESEYLRQIDTVSAVKIERTSSTGSELITDLSEQVGQEIRGFTGAGGCGCSSASSIGALPSLLGGLLALVGFRRRR